MEYTVGSIADLISGKNTPNKPKIVKKEIVAGSKGLKRKSISGPETNINDKIDYKNKEKSIKITKRKKTEHVKETDYNDKIVPENTMKSIKKLRRKIPDNSNEAVSSPPKKRKTNDENAERRIKKKEKLEKIQDPEELARTLFVGNVPLDITKKALKKLFGKYGDIESIRFRGIAVANPNTPKKVAAIKKEFHPDRKNCISFIKFFNKEDAEKAQAEDGMVFQEHHFKVQVCSATKNKPDETKAIFVGNLNFDATEDDLWRLFEDCGPISHVRVIRDGRSGMGRGFGYVNFKDSDSVQLALELENIKLKGRELRISLSNLNNAKKKKNKKFNLKKVDQKTRKPNKTLIEKKKKIKKIAPHDK